LNPNEFGKRMGIGVRVAGRIAKKRFEEKSAATPTGQSQSVPLPNLGQMHAQVTAQVNSQVREATREVAKKTPRYARAAGRGAGAFFRPFRRVGGILWLEVTGFFFALFALYFATDLWRIRQNYAQGPQHQHFLISAAMLILFAYLSASSFWRTKRK